MTLLSPPSPTHTRRVRATAPRPRADAGSACAANSTRSPSVSCKVAYQRWSRPPQTARRRACRRGRSWRRYRLFPPTTSRNDPGRSVPVRPPSPPAPRSTPAASRPRRPHSRSSSDWRHPRLPPAPPSPAACLCSARQRRQLLPTERESGGQPSTVLGVDAVQPATPPIAAAPALPVCEPRAVSWSPNLCTTSSPPRTATAQAPPPPPTSITSSAPAIGAAWGGRPFTAVQSISGFMCPSYVAPCHITGRIAIAEDAPESSIAR